MRNATKHICSLLAGFLLLLQLSSCTAIEQARERRQEKKAKAFYRTNKEKLAALCAEDFPVVESSKSDTTTIHDTLPPLPGDTLISSSRTTIRTHTTTTIKTNVRTVDSAGNYTLRQRAAQAEERAHSFEIRAVKAEGLASTRLWMFIAAAIAAGALGAVSLSKILSPLKAINRVSNAIHHTEALPKT